MLHVGADGSHEVEAGNVEEVSIGDASLADSAGGNIGSGSRESKAKGPAGLGNLLAALIGAFLELVLTSTRSLALLVLIRALLLNALDQFRRLGKDDGEEEHKGDDDLHSYFMIIDY